MSAKQTSDDKLQGDVAAYLMCSGVVNNQIKKGLLLGLRVKKLKSANIWQSYKQKRDSFATLVISESWNSGIYQKTNNWKSAWNTSATVRNSDF